MNKFKVKNLTADDVSILGRIIPTMSYADLSADEAKDFADDDGVFKKLSDGDLVVNDGKTDLNARYGWEHLRGDITNVKVAQTSEVGDKKLWVHQSAKPEVDGKQFFVQWSGRGDKVGEIGKGEYLNITMAAEDTEKHVDVSFDPAYGEVYMHEAYAMWENTGHTDSFSVDICQSNTNANCGRFTLHNC